MAAEPVCSLNQIVPEIRVPEIRVPEIKVPKIKKPEVNRTRLLEEIINHLEASLKLNIGAAEQAHETATHSENVAENRYDTLGLEAAYLAHGQSQRVVAGEVDIVSFKALRDLPHSESITLGSLVALADEDDRTQLLFIGPAAGGLKLVFDQNEIVVITPSAPLGQSLMGHFVHEEIEFSAAGKTNIFDITAIY
jgi:transcription elongation GreA/GreB family factor